MIKFIYIFAVLLGAATALSCSASAFFGSLLGFFLCGCIGSILICICWELLQAELRILDIESRTSGDTEALSIERAINNNLRAEILHLEGRLNAETRAQQ
jgi:hypothetical protein